MRAVQIIETIKAGAMESDTLIRLTGYQARVSNAHRVVGSISSQLVALPPILLLLTTAAVLWIGGGRVIEGALSIGALLATQTLMVNFHRPFAELVKFGSNFQLLQAHVARIDDVLKHEPDPFFSPGGVSRDDPPRRISGRLVMKNVTFGYNRATERPLIEDFCLEIAPGSRVAIVGSSGSGKSTIGRLACGLYAPWSGEITYDGYRIDEIPREVFTNDVAFVDDQAFLVTGSVRENLTLWDETIATEDMHARVIDAAIHGDLACAARGVRDAPGRGRAEPVRRPAPAPGDRPRARARAFAPGARRGHERAGHAHRAARGRQSPASGLRVPDHRASAQHHSRLRRDPRDAPGPGRSARLARGANARGRRPLPRASSAERR